MSYDNPSPEQETTGNTNATPAGVGAHFTKDDENNDQSDVETSTLEDTPDES